MNVVPDGLLSVTVDALVSVSVSSNVVVVPSLIDNVIVPFKDRLVLVVVFWKSTSTDTPSVVALVTLVSSVTGINTGLTVAVTVSVIGLS